MLDTSVLSSVATVWIAVWAAVNWMVQVARKPDSVLDDQRFARAKAACIYRKVR